jgi:hypothetical protein
MLWIELGVAAIATLELLACRVADCAAISACCARRSRADHGLELCRPDRSRSLWLMCSMHGKYCLESMLLAAPRTCMFDLSVDPQEVVSTSTSLSVDLSVDPQEVASTSTSLIVDLSVDPQEVVSTSTSSGWTSEALSQMGWADAVSREVLRFRPIVPTMFRKATKDLDLSGRRVPKVSGWPCVCVGGGGLLCARVTVQPPSDYWLPDTFCQTEGHGHVHNSQSTDQDSSSVLNSQRASSNLQCADCNASMFCSWPRRLSGGFELSGRRAPRVTVACLYVFSVCVHVCCGCHGMCSPGGAVCTFDAPMSGAHVPEGIGT